ncbi:MAG TPA: fasciclin domain-containing protein [Nocardioidaceae bacterium]|nr:fasciclin domain-containing protein [Nocardioidaceae bacterium]
MRTMKRIAAATAVVSALTMTAACGSDSGDSAAGDTAGSTPSESSSPMDSSSSAAPMDDVAANLAGPGCAAYAKQVPNGSGSVAGMAADPVAVAASNNPLLTTLTAAVSGKLNKKVDLVDTLNGSEFTVFAPVDAAFAKLPKATVKLLGTPKGAETLTTVLTYHVVAGQMTPQQVAGKTLTTVQGGKLEISGTPDKLKAQGANVICGGVKTANATVYLVDGVLMPPKM